MLDAIRADFDTMFAGSATPEGLHLGAVYSGDRTAAEEWLAEVQAAFPGFDIPLAPLSLSVACHIGPGALAITASKAIAL